MPCQTSIQADIWKGFRVICNILASFHLYQLTKFSKNLIRCIKYLRLIYVTIKYEGVLNDVDQFILYVAYNYMCSLSAPSQDNILN